VEELKRAADDYVLGRLGAEELPMAAALALARGVDSPALRELAGLGRADVRDATDLFERVMTDLGHPLRSSQAVRWDRARQVAARLLDGTAAAPDAAWEIAALLYEPDRGRWSDLAMRFEVLAVDWDDHPDHHPSITGRIEVAARALLLSSGT
jgi:hypothetical protein